MNQIANKANAPHAAPRRALKMNRQSTDQLKMSHTARPSNLPRHMTLMLSGHPVRILNRCDETWVVASDLLIAAGSTTTRVSHWRQIPELERDVDFFKTASGKDEVLKIISLSGLPYMLRNTPIHMASKVLQWAQLSLCTEAA